MPPPEEVGGAYARCQSEARAAFGSGDVYVEQLIRKARHIEVQGTIACIDVAVGEVVLLSPGNFKGHWNRPEETAATQRDGWVHTGDMGRLDGDGYLTFLGRFKKMIKVSGYSVFPDEVEAILSKHPAVAQIAVIGIPDPAKGEVVKAVIVLKPDAKGTISADEFIAWSRENLSAYKVPRSVEFRDLLTATATGKVLRRLAR